MHYLRPEGVPGQQQPSQLPITAVPVSPGAPAGAIRAPGAARTPDGTECAAAAGLYASWLLCSNSLPVQPVPPAHVQSATPPRGSSPAAQHPGASPAAVDHLQSAVITESTRPRTQNSAQVQRVQPPFERVRQAGDRTLLGVAQLGRVVTMP